MNTQLVITLALLVMAVAMFALNRPRVDAVALLMMAALPLAGVISVPQALAGFADPNVVLIALMFVIGESLVRTGIAQRLGDWLVARAGADEKRLIVLLMLIVAGIGSVMSSTGVVAIFIPIVLRIARQTGTAPGRLMMPLAIAALTSGMLTLVATPPNLVVQAELVREGHAGFGFFAFSPFGLPILALAIVYMLLTRRWLADRSNPGSGPGSAPHRVRPHLLQWIDEYGLAAREFRLRVGEGSPLAGPTLEQLALRATSGVNLLAIERNERFGRRLIAPAADLRLQAGDVLFLDALDTGVDLPAVAQRYALKALPLSGSYFNDLSQSIGMAEVMLPADSPLLGQTMTGARMRSRLGVTAIGLKRSGSAHRGRLAEAVLGAGDTLLVVGPWSAIRELKADTSQLVVIALPVEFDDVTPAGDRAPFALGTLALVVVLMATGVVPNVQAALIGCLLMGLFGCIDMPNAYRAIHWQSLVLIVGMLPFSLALQKTGGVDLAAQALLSVVGAAGPRTVLAALFAVTALLGMFISNTATAVLMAPVALAVAAQLGASPLPFAMTVALAASAAFMTPVSSPVNTLVLGPGGYSFMSFVRIGVPLALLTGAVTVLLVPWLLPL